MIRQTLVIATTVGSVAIGVPDARATLTYGGTCGVDMACETISGAVTASAPTGLTGVSGSNPEIINVDQANTGFFPGYTVTSVTLSFSGILSPTVTVRNPFGTASAGTVTVASTFTLDALNTALNTAISAIPVSGPVSEVLNTGTVAGRSSATVSGSTTQSAGSITISSNNPSLFSLFEGSGTVELGAITSVTSATPSNGFSVTSSTLNAAGLVSVAYTYSPVPEPASVLVLASGLLGLVMLRNRRQG